MPETVSFEFDSFSDNFELLIDELDSWPDMRVDLTFDIHPAEPDVGIFTKQVEVTAMTFYLDDEAFTDEEQFAAAVYAAVEDVIDADEAQVASEITKALAGMRDQIETGG